MKLNEFLYNLNKMVVQNPEILNYDVIYNKDDGKNVFNKINFNPILCHLDVYEFYPDYEINEKEYKMKINSICIN